MVRGRPEDVPPHLKGDTVTIGHEVSGTVAEVGPKVTGLSIGQRVVLQARDVRDGAMHTKEGNPLRLILRP